MVPRAKQHQIVERRSAAVDPVHHVMRVAAARRAARKHTASIARGQRWQEPALAPLDEETAGLPADPGDAEREHGVHELRAFIAGLDELNRALILLWLDELSYREIADVLGISETNVATRINRAKQTLRARMNPAGE